MDLDKSTNSHRYISIFNRHFFKQYENLNFVNIYVWYGKDGSKHYKIEYALLENKSYDIPKSIDEINNMIDTYYNNSGNDKYIFTFVLCAKDDDIVECLSKLLLKYNPLMHIITFDKATYDCDTLKKINNNVDSKSIQVFKKPNHGATMLYYVEYSEIYFSKEIIDSYNEYYRCICETFIAEEYIILDHIL